MKTVTVSAPGKIMLSGEWSVLERGNPCIVLALDKRVYATVFEAKKTSVKLTDFNITSGAAVNGTQIQFENKDTRLVFTKHAIETVLSYLKGRKVKTKGFSLETRSEISNVKVNGAEMKPGLGSSAAAVVAIIGALLQFHGVGIGAEVRASASKAPLRGSASREASSLNRSSGWPRAGGEEKEKEALFKLAIIAHYLAQGKIGSGFDVAASVFGGALVYKSFDAQWLAKELEKKKIREVAEEKWPLFEHKGITLPKNFDIVIGFTGKSASTSKLVQNMKKFKEEQAAEYDKIMFWLRETTEGIVAALEGNEPKEVLTLIDENERLLRGLGEESGNELETAEHRKIIEIASKHYASAKLSGAGGGDCAICVCFERKTAEQVKTDLKAAGLVVIEAGVSEEGIRAET